MSILSERVQALPGDLDFAGIERQDRAVDELDQLTEHRPACYIR